jgi:hypothetical protein
MTYRIDDKGLVVTFADVVYRRDAPRAEARVHFSRCRITSALLNQGAGAIRGTGVGTRPASSRRVR